MDYGWRTGRGSWFSLPSLFMPASPRWGCADASKNSLEPTRAGGASQDPKAQLRPSAAATSLLAGYPSVCATLRITLRDGDLSPRSSWLT